MTFSMCKERENQKSTFIIALITLIFGVLLRLLYCILYPVPVRDAFTYKRIIMQWLETGEIPREDCYPPLGIYLFKVPSEWFEYDIIKGGTVINMITGLLIIIVILKICQLYRLSQTTILIIGLIYAAHPTLIDYSCQMTRENSYLLFLFLFTYHALKYFKTGQTKQICSLSLFSCAAELCRYEAIELVPISIAIFFLADIKNPRKAIKSLTLYFLCWILSIVLISMIIGVPLNYYKTYLDEIKSFATDNLRII